MFDNKSDYALNKKGPNSIVYNGIDGGMVRIKKEDFSSDEEFLFWKSWSDEDYKETDYADSYYHRHTVGLDSIGDNIKNTSTPEEVLICKLERDEQIQGAADLVQMFSESLTEVQFRRLWLHHVQGENVRNIAQQEGVVHSCVVASITSAERKILKIVSKSTTKNK